jgi:hypothetical protein
MDVVGDDPPPERASQPPTILRNADKSAQFSPPSTHSNSTDLQHLRGNGSASDGPQLSIRTRRGQRP